MRRYGSWWQKLRDAMVWLHCGGKRQNFVDKGQNVWSLRSTKDLMGISVHCFSLYIAFLSFFPVALQSKVPLQEEEKKKLNTTKKVVVITNNIVVIRCYCNDKKDDASHCNKVRSNRFMQHLIFVAINYTYCNDLL